MEPQQPQTTVVNNPPPPAPVQKKNNMPKILLGVVVVILLLAGLAGAYFLGQNNSSQNTSAVPTVMPTTTQTQNTTSTPTATPTTAAGKSVSAGQKIGVFMPYKITVPDDWTSSDQSTKDVLDVLTISKGAYKIEIRQAGGEGSACLYGNEPEQMFSQKYTTFVEFKSLDENLRRSGTANANAWTICHQTQNGWQLPTLYGYVSYAVPANADDATLKQMDSIVATIVKQ